MKNGVAMALSLGVIMLMTVIIGVNARLLYDAVGERLSAPSYSTETSTDNILKGSAKSNAPHVGGYHISNAGVVD